MRRRRSRSQLYKLLPNNGLRHVYTITLTNIHKQLIITSKQVFMCLM